MVQAFAHPSSGVPRSWGVTEAAAGLNVLPDLSEEGLGLVCRQVEAVRRPGDVVVVSLHWGSNWGYDIPQSHRRFAHMLIDGAHVSIVHGHSSHHAKAIEVYNNRLILYGCGDFLNDYEGITGKEEFRGDLTLMYFATVDDRTGDLVQFMNASAVMLFVFSGSVQWKEAAVLGVSAIAGGLIGAKMLAIFRRISCASLS